MARNALTKEPSLSYEDGRQKSEKKSGCYFTTALGTVPLILVVKWLWPEVIPFEFFQFWKFDGTLKEVFVDSWLLFAWGIGVTALFSFITWNNPRENEDAESLYAFDLFRSVIAGICEEISFRWLFFYSAIVTLKVANFLLLGFLGLNIVKGVYGGILVPLADICTLQYLHPFLYQSSWAVGAAIISSNGKFRDGHADRGLFGCVNSWFCGMFFFWLMFTYGLFAAIIVHAAYDIFVFTIRYIDRVVERRLGWV